MPRVHRLISVLAVALAALAVSSTAAAATPDAKLLRTYQPVLVFHPAESFRPTKVQAFIEDSELERFTGSVPAQLPLDQFWTPHDDDPGPGTLGNLGPGLFRLDQQSCSAAAALGGLACYAAASADDGGAAMYGRVVRTGDHTVLQYWLFYYHNPLVLPLTPVGPFWQSHEGDWESVHVILDASEQPVQAAYSQHCSGQRRAWADVEKRPAGSTHPVAYVGLGSHASFFAPGAGPLGAVPIDPTCIPPAVLAALPSLPFLQVGDQVVDGTSVGAVAGPPGSDAAAATIHRIEGAPWAEFNGFWGESEYFFTPITLGPVPGGTAVPVGVAPATPPLQTGKWNATSIFTWPVAP
ncbi:MAG: hypothetical protein ICV64_07705 [Thermoleophilia bacterium]|nr:hypothetical protein [Thermoleophilia bacterium]